MLERALENTLLNCTLVVAKYHQQEEVVVGIGGDSGGCYWCSGCFWNLVRKCVVVVAVGVLFLKWLLSEMLLP